MKKIFYLTSFLALFTIQHTEVLAARVYVETDKPAIAGQVTTFYVKLDTEGKTINVVDASIAFIGMTKDVTNIHTGGSIFNLWPTRPSLSGNTISFTGGAPSGVSGTNLLLFSVVAIPHNIKNSYIDFKSVTAYINDTTASSLSLVEKPASLSSLPVSAQTSDKTDTETAPFTVELGRDPSSFDGKYFISFVAQNSTGINHYEIQEGNNPPVRSGSPYVLQDQSRKNKVTVVAIDNTGKPMLAVLPASATFPWATVITSLILLLGVILGIRTYRK
jgi:hypothetical protein